MKKVSAIAGLLLSMLVGVAFCPVIAIASMLGDKPEMVSSFDGGFFGVGFYQDQMKLKVADGDSGGSGVTLSRLQAYSEIGVSLQKHIIGAFRVGAVRSEKLIFDGDSSPYGGTVPFVGFTSGGPILTFNKGNSGLNALADVEYTGNAEREDTVKRFNADSSYTLDTTKKSIKNLVQVRAGVVAHHLLWQSTDKGMGLLGYSGVFYNAAFASIESASTSGTYSATNTLTSSRAALNTTTMKAAVPFGILMGVKLNVSSLGAKEAPDRWSVALEAQYQGALGGGVTIARTF